MRELLEREARVAEPEFAVAGFAPDLVPYAIGLELQTQAAERVRRSVDHGTVIMLEHPAVYTAGRRASRDDYPIDGTPVIEVDRGGLVTWHGPGQLVVYPVVRLRPGVGVVDLVRALEETLIRSMADLGLAGIRVDGRSGVWAEHDGAAQKVAQIGLHARAGVITHGLALNCSNDLEPFTRFVPCGIRDASVTTLSTLAGRVIRPVDAAPVVETRLRATLAELIA